MTYIVTCLYLTTNHYVIFLYHMQLFLTLQNFHYEIMLIQTSTMNCTPLAYHPDTNSFIQKSSKQNQAYADKIGKNHKVL
jgi:hypothetical protein